MGELRDSPEAQELARSEVAAASREPQALRPEGAIVVITHLLCRTVNAKSLAAALNGGQCVTSGHLRIEDENA